MDSSDASQLASAPEERLANDGCRMCQADDVCKKCRRPGWLDGLRDINTGWLGWCVDCNTNWHSYYYGDEAGRVWPEAPLEGDAVQLPDGLAAAPLAIQQQEAARDMVTPPQAGPPPSGV